MLYSSSAYRYRFMSNNQRERIHFIYKTENSNIKSSSSWWLITSYTSVTRWTGRVLCCYQHSSIPSMSFHVVGRRTTGGCPMIRGKECIYKTILLKLILKMLIQQVAVVIPIGKKTPLLPDELERHYSRNNLSDSYTVWNL